MPIVGRGLSAEQTCWYHQGSANSFLNSVHLLPDIVSGVVVLTNSMAQNDVADWLGELYVEALLDNPDKNDYVSLARTSAETALQLWPSMQKELEQNRIHNTPVLPFDRYVGIYYNKIENFRIEIVAKDGALFLRFQQEKRLAYQLTHYHYNTFSWLISHDRNVKVGRFPITRASFYLIHFKTSPDNETKIDSLVWAHDDYVLSGERYFKTEAVPETSNSANANDQVVHREIDALARSLDGKTVLPNLGDRKPHTSAIVATVPIEPANKLSDPAGRVESSKI